MATCKVCNDPDVELRLETTNENDSRWHDFCSWECVRVYAKAHT